MNDIRLRTVDGIRVDCPSQQIKYRGQKIVVLRNTWSGLKYVALGHDIFHETHVGYYKYDIMSLHDKRNKR